MSSSSPHISSVRPAAAIEGGRITVEGSGFVVDGPRLPEVRIGPEPARVVFASSTRLGCLVPAVSDSGPAAIRIGEASDGTVRLNAGAPLATGLHQVDNPVFDAEGNLYVTYSGTRGQEVPVSIFRVRPDGTRETFSSGIVNPTSMAVDRQKPAVCLEPVRGDGVPRGRRRRADAVRDRSRRRVRPGVRARRHAVCRRSIRHDLPAGRARPGGSRSRRSRPSVAAFHLALAPDGALYVTAPTLSAYDAVYRVAPDGAVSVRYEGFGRPQGVALDRQGRLLVVEALAGTCGLYRFGAEGPPELVLAGPSLVGLAFDPHRGLVVCSNDTAYRLTIDL